LHSHFEYPITARTSNKVIDDDRVQEVSFTGSDGSGAQVAERAGRNVKKLILELGGSDPFVVLEDAEPRLVAKA
jgi:succinate-semialdehyde dehydrogenase/glutarate-semialdehyde dehydrogenase